MKAILSVLFFSILLSFTCFSQTQDWVATYEDSLGGNVSRIRMIGDGDGNIYIAGRFHRIDEEDQSLTGYLVLKYNSDGELQWDRYYFPPNIDHNENSGAYGIAVDDSGNVYVTGELDFRSLPGDSKDFDIVTIKYNSQGDTLWIQRYDSLSDDYGRDLILDHDGNVYVGGRSSDNATTCFFVLLKYSPQGDLIWKKLLEGYYDLRYLSSSNENYVTATGYYSDKGLYLFTADYDSSGNLQWTAEFNGGNGESHGIFTNSNSDIMITGVSDGNRTQGDFMTIKYNSSGEEQWAVRQTSTQGPSQDNSYDIICDENGSAYVTGVLNEGSYYYISATIKYDENGDKAWVSTYEPPPFPNTTLSSTSSIALDDSNNVYVFGTTWDISNWDETDFLTIKYNEDGNEVWSEVYAHTGKEICNSGGIFGGGLVIDNDNNVYISGDSEPDPGSGETSTDIILIKYNQNGDGKIHNESQANLKSNHFFICQNNPNPFNPSTKIQYAIPKAGDVQLVVYDILGRQVATLVNEFKTAGIYTVDFNASSLASGIYFYRIKSGSFTDTKKMLLVK